MSETTFYLGPVLGGLILGALGALFNWLVGPAAYPAALVLTGAVSGLRKPKGTLTLVGSGAAIPVGTQAGDLPKVA